VPFGPEISWPYGFRQMDTEERRLLESAYGTGYQQSAMDDYGYGDPGYSDPSYEGPKTPYDNPAFPGGYQDAAPRAFGDAGYRPSGGSSGGTAGGSSGGGMPGYYVPDTRDSARSGYSSPGYQRPESGPPAGGQEIWPVTGAQEALPDTGPQPEARGGASRSGGVAYPEQWYGHPRLDEPAHDDSRPSRSADPRLAGMTYGELRYDDAGPETPGASGGSAYDEPLDDESWYRELRRSAPAYPQSPGGPQGPASGPQRRVDPPGPSFGSQPGYSPAPDRAPGHGQPRRDGSGPQASSSAERPQMSAGRRPSGPAAPGAGFLSAPTASVGLLTPPAGTRVDALRDGGARPAAPAASPSAGSPRAGSSVLTAPAAPAAPAAPSPARPARPAPATVRPGHGLDGPEITSSWPIQPAAEDLESYEDFWREDADEEYTGLFGDREAEFERAAAKQAAARKTVGRRSNDHRLWLGLGGVVVVAAAAIVGIVKFELPSHSGPAHTMAIRDKIGAFTRTMDLEHQADVDALRQKVIKMSSGQASRVVSAVYESGKSAVGNNAQIIMFIGGHLANADPAASITSFTQQFRGAQVVSAGALGGKAACVQDGTGAKVVSMCVWFDNDSFGEIVSPTMSASALARDMQTVRPAVEQVSGK
jgi:hypothetical protein